MWYPKLGRLVCSLAREFGHGFLCTIVIDQRLAGSSGGNQSGDGRIVERSCQPQAEFVQPCDGIIGEERATSASTLPSASATPGRSDTAAPASRPPCPPLRSSAVTRRRAI